MTQTASVSSHPYESEMFNALRDHGPLTYHELYLAVKRIFGGASAGEFDSCLFRMRERGEVKRAGLRPPGEHLFKLL